MATATTTNSQAAIKSMAEADAFNNRILALSFKEWTRLQCVSTPGPTWTYATGSDNVVFQLKSADRSVLKFRIRFTNIGVTYTAGTGGGGLNPFPLMGLLSKFEVSLGNTVYKVNPQLFALILTTFATHGRRYYDVGTAGTAAGYTYSSDLYEFTLSGSTINGWVDVPMAWLVAVGDATGIAPTLSSSPLTVTFSTPSTLSNTDPLKAPVYVTGDATYDLTSGQSGTVDIYAQTTTGLSPVGNTPNTPDSVVGTPIYGAGIMITERVLYPNTAATLEDYFVAFQEGSAEKDLLKAIVVLDNPGEVVGQYAENREITRADLMFDSRQVAVSINNSNNTKGLGWIDNFFTDQRLKYGDLPPGVLVYDFLAGTDPAYPNDLVGAFNLAQKPSAGVTLSYTGTLKAGASIHVVGMFGRANLYTATAPIG